MIGELLCGDRIYLKAFEELLVSNNAYHSEDYAWQMLVDKPVGWALLERPEYDYANCVVLTENRCPAYQLTLLDKEPLGLLDLRSLHAVVPALNAISAGQTVYPRVTTPLTKVERLTLHLLSRGHHNKEIAAKRKVSESTVKNSLYEIYKKLNLKTRVEATHYYLGNWHLLDNWQRPGHLL